MYENRADGSGQADRRIGVRERRLSRASVCVRAPVAELLAPHRPIGNRSPPLVRAPPATRSADAAHSLRARPGAEEPCAETPVSPPLRGRPRPSETETPRLPQRSSIGEFPGPSPVGLARGDPCRGDPEAPPEARLSNPPSVASAPPATRTDSCRSRPHVLAPAVTRPRPGYAVSERRAADAARAGRDTGRRTTPVPRLSAASTPTGDRAGGLPPRVTGGLPG